MARETSINWLRRSALLMRRFGVDFLLAGMVQR